MCSDFANGRLMDLHRKAGKMILGKEGLCATFKAFSVRKRSPHGGGRRWKD